MIINEDSRNQLMAKNKSSSYGGLKRFKRRIKSKVGTSTRQYNKIDMNRLFKDGILTIGIEVHGETDDYVVRISFGGLFDILHDELKRNNGVLEFRNIVKALIIAFNKENVYIDCSCPDFRYRFKFWATKNDILSGSPETRPSDQTNPHDNLGSGCKHIMLVLSNTSWIIKVASVINNYIKYMEKHMQKLYADIIYPKVYGKKYEEPIQTSTFDSDELDSDEETINTSNDEGRTRGQFKPGNEYRFQKQNKPIKNQVDAFDEIGDDEEA